MERISVNASGKYDVVIGRGLIGDSAGLISPLLGSGRLAVITDDNVKNFCLGALKASLESAGNSLRGVRHSVRRELKEHDNPRHCA